ncbi:hypothetical protein RRG08_033166 [Elysia crispata]|uniref:Uncharacterized protein n=1 Tax=Elysia crispata TaxID=231223 RepID=A0AAE0YYL6_9GAST|nr:hypothetical protein RRG08_033166 [Elysia crispata]
MCVNCKHRETLGSSELEALEGQAYIFHRRASDEMKKEVKECVCVCVCGGEGHVRGLLVVMVTVTVTISRHSLSCHPWSISPLTIVRHLKVSQSMLPGPVPGRGKKLVWPNSQHTRDREDCLVIPLIDFTPD